MLQDPRGIMAIIYNHGYHESWPLPENVCTVVLWTGINLPVDQYFKKRSIIVCGYGIIDYACINTYKHAHTLASSLNYQNG